MIGNLVYIRAILKSTIRKAKVHAGIRYSFGSLMTRYLMDLGIQEYDINYRLLRDGCMNYVTKNQRSKDTSWPCIDNF